MNIKNNRILTSILLIGAFFCLVILAPKVSATTIAAEGLIDVGEELQLSYYFGAKSGNAAIDPNRVQVANVNFLTKGKRVNHLFGNGSNQGNISIGFNGSNSYVNPRNIEIQSITGGGKDSTVTAIYTANYDGNKFEITSTLTPRGNNIIVSDSIKNISGKDLKDVWIARSYDTMLDGNDSVPVRYLGKNDGIYIAQNEFKLSYNFHLPIGPEGWAAARYNSKIIPDVFSSSTNLGQADLNKPADDIAFNNGDSEVFMKWSPKDFPRDSTREVGYIVGVTPENVDAPEVTVEKESFEYLGGNFDLKGTVVSKDPSVKEMKMYYQVDRENPKEFKKIANSPLGAVKNWSTVIPEAELTGGYPKQISVYAIDSNGYYSDSKTVDLTEPKSQPVTVKYLNQEGKLLKDTKLVGRYGETYQAEILEFANYTVGDTPANINGTISNVPQEVIIRYVGNFVGETNGKIIARYVNQQGVAIAEELIATGNGLFGSPYKTEEKAIEHYEFVGVDANGAPKTGLYTNSLQVVTFNYRGKDVGEKGKITVEYRNQEGKLLDQAFITGKYGDTYDVSDKLLKEFKYYTRDSLPNNSKGTITDQPQKVIITYTGESFGNSSGKVTVKYLNQEGNEIVKEEQAKGSGLFGGAYTTEQKAIPNYEFKEVDSSHAGATGFYSEKPQTVIYKYTGKAVGEAGKVTVEYRNQVGKLLDSDFIIGRYGDSYDISLTHLKEFDYYISDSLPANSKGTINNQPQTIVVTYTGTQVGDNQGKVKAKYLNQEGLEIANEENGAGSGLFGSPYTTEQKAIPNYEFKEIDASGAKQTGFYQATAQTVIYKYKGKSVGENGKITIEYRNQVGTLLDQAFINGNYGDKYDLETHNEGTLIKNFDHYTIDTLPVNSKGTINNQPQTIVVTYTGTQVGDNKGKVKAKYLNQEGLEIANEENGAGSGLFGSPYTTEQKAIPNYEFKEIDASGAKQTGFYQATAQTVIYKYKGKSVGENGKITIEYRNQVGTLLDQSFINGNYGDKYDLETHNEGTLIKNFDHYTRNRLPENKKGAITNEPQLITLTYLGELVGNDKGKVTATYVNQAGEVISEATNASGDGRYGSPYTTEQKEIANYDFTGVSSTGALQTGTYSLKPQTVIFDYLAQKGGKINVKYENQNGKELKTEVFTGNVGNTVAITPPTTGIFSNYTLLPNQILTATFNKNEQTITIKYEGKAAKPITVTHIGTDGHIFDKNVFDNQKYGDPYQFDVMEPEGYSFDRVVGGRGGTYTNEKQQVTFYYKKNPAKMGILTVKYIEADTGKELAPLTKLTGVVGSEYPNTLKPLKGYQTPGRQTGRFQENSREITYAYTKIAKIGGSITVKYVNNYGRPFKGLAQKEIPGELIGTPLAHDKIDVDGHTIVSSKPERTTVKFTATKQVITCTVRKEIQASGRSGVSPVVSALEEATIRYVNDADPDNMYEIVDSYSATGLAGSPIWKAEYLPEFIEDYQLVSDYENFKTELFAEGQGIINVVYRFNPTTNLKKEVKIKMIDASGNLLKTVAKVVTVGEVYTIDIPLVEGYNYLQDESMNLTGTWEEGMSEEYTLTYDLI